MKKPLEILIVEDNEKHLKDAKNKVSEMQDAGVPIKVEFAYDKNSALKIADNYECVISDVFMPSEGKEVHKEDKEACKNLLPQRILEDYHYSGAAKEWIEGDDLPPNGILVAEYCKEKGIPILFCSDLQHHASKMEPVFHYACGIDMVETYLNDDYNMPAHEKNWQKAIEQCILYQIVKEEKDTIKGFEDFEDNGKSIQLIKQKLEEYNIDIEKYEAKKGDEPLEAYQKMEPIWDALEKIKD